MNACDAVQELLTAHLMTALGPSEDALVLDHLESCEVCCVVKDETEACVALLTAPPVKAPEQVWTKIRTRIEREAAGDPIRHSEPSPVISFACSFCRGGMTREIAVYCASCLAPHHPECFREHGRCSVMGCAESRIVRPSELPPLQLQVHAGGKQEEKDPEEEQQEPPPPRRRRFGRWIGSGLGLVAAGIGIAALTQTDPAPDGVLPEWEVRPAVDRRAEYRVEMDQATLGELCEAISKLPKNPNITLADDCRDLLVRHASIDGVHWSEALSRIAGRFDLRVSEDEKGWRIDRPQDFNASDHPRATGSKLELDTTRLVPLEGEKGGGAIHQGWAYDLHVAPDARTLAIQEGRKLSLFQGLERKGFAILEAPCTAVAWSRDGRGVAYVAGEDDGGQLGVFDLTSFKHSVVQSFEGADPSSQLVWCGDDERILLKTRVDVQLVSTIKGASAVTLTNPSPSGYRRFDLLALSTPGRFLILYPDGVEAWQLANTATPLYESRRRLPPGYEISGSVSGDRCVVLTASKALLLDASSGTLMELEERSSVEPDAKFQVDLDPAGTHVAFLKRHADSEDEELMVRPLDPQAALRKCEPESGVVQGFRWAPEGRTLVFWTEDSCYVENVDRRVLTPTRVKEYEEARIIDVRWVRLPSDVAALAITSRGLSERKGEARVERVGD